MPRVINPQLASLALATPERSLIDALDARLPPEWDFYIHPVLNGLRFSLALLHPQGGVALVEVLTPSSDIKRIYDRQNLARDEIRELYCPRRDTKAGPIPVATTIFVPSECDSTELGDALGALPQQVRKNIRQRMVDPVRLEGDPDRAVLPAIAGGADRRLYQDLRSWLLEPDFRGIRREPLELNGKQRDLATSRTPGGYRRIRGPAGSGKTQVLAARAAQLASEGKAVLFVSFNLTLLNFVREGALRWSVFDSPARTAGPLRRITFLNYHHWAKRVFELAGREDEYRRLWVGVGDDEDALQRVLDTDLPQAVAELLAGSQHTEAYDGIVVDEGQDFRPEWLKTLRQVLRPGGEFVLALDLTQDLYGRAPLLTPGAWEGCGFAGAWTQLSVSYRLPPRVARLASAFLETFMRDAENDAPVAVAAQADLFPSLVRWVQVAEPRAEAVCADEICKMVPHAEPTELAIPDTVFVSDTIAFGRAVSEAVMARGLQVSHTFAADQQLRRQQKAAFLFDDAPVKGTTIHSFKGWETRALVMYLGPATRSATWRAVYTALTRLKRTPGGSALTVVSANPSLRDFGRRYADVFVDVQ